MLSDRHMWDDADAIRSLLIHRELTAQGFLQRYTTKANLTDASDCVRSRDPCELVCSQGSSVSLAAAPGARDSAPTKRPPRPGLLVRPAATPR